MSRRRIVAGTLAFLGAAIALWSSSRPAATEPRSLPKIPRSISAGDVIFFRTTTWRGRLVRVLQDNDDDFTHAGIILDAGTNDAHVIHACPVKPAMVRIERLSDLLAEDEITSVAFYRPRVRAAEALRAALIAQTYATHKVPFDFEFDLTNDRAVYCTELIWLSYRMARLKLRSSGDILFPADLIDTGFFEPLFIERARPAEDASAQ